MTPLTPEQRAREKIDASLVESGWTFQNRDVMNLSAARGVAVREFTLAQAQSASTVAQENARAVAIDATARGRSAS